MLGLTELGLAARVLKNEQADELIRVIMRKYAETSVQNARELLQYSVVLSDIALKQTEEKSNKAHFAAETLINFFDSTADEPMFFAAMVPVCQVVFPEGTSEGGSQKQKEFFAKFVKLLRDPQCFSWDNNHDREWAEMFGYTNYLRKVKELNG